MKIRCTLLLAGAAIGACCSVASAAVVSLYSENFELPRTLNQLTQWGFADVHSGIPTLDTHPDSTTLNDATKGPITSPTRFLGEFGGDDAVHLTLDLLPHTESVRIKFDAYLLRTWDGTDVNFAGPDTFGYGVAGRTPIVDNTFSNGQGKQSYCPNLPSTPTPSCDPTTGSDPNLKNKLGFQIQLDPVPGGPPAGTDMSLVYHFDSGPIAFTGDQITFDFFSRNLQLHPVDTHSAVSDESWGLDNVIVSAVVPEPQTWTLLLAGLLLLSYAGTRHERSSR